MIAYIAIVKAWDGETAPCYDTNVVNSIAVKYNSMSWKYAENPLFEDFWYCREMESYSQEVGWCWRKMNCARPEIRNTTGRCLFCCPTDSVKSLTSPDPGLELCIVYSSYLLLRALVHSLLWRPGNWGKRPHSRSAGKKKKRGDVRQSSTKDRHSKNVTILNIQWA